MKQQAEYPIEELRRMVSAFSNCSESFLMRWTLPQLLQIWRAWDASAWDNTPDNWTARQIREALRGHAPKWDSNELPIYQGEES
jgi:hypothetical protein